jgi:hypothetical protein
MQARPLFRDQPLQFKEKAAGTLTRLGDNTDNWPQEITQEAYKQLPFLSDFEPHVILDKVDEQKGAAWGSIECRPKTEMTVEEMHTSPIDKVHIPIIIKDQQLYPFDTFMNGKKYDHLTEGRLRAALFRPEPMDVPRQRPPEPSMTHELHPPLTGVLGSKLGSAMELLEVPVLPQLHGRVLQQHADRIKQACEDPSLRAQISNADEGVMAAFNSALSLQPTDPEKTASLVRDSIRPSVVQLKKLANGNVMVKWANPEAFAPQQQEVPMSVAQDLHGEQDLTGVMENDGTVTASPNAPIKETMEAEEIKVADSFGLWKVQDLQGNTMIGWVFPQLMSLAMQPLPLSLFNNGSQHAVQENIAGEMAGKSVDLPKGEPRGYGCLYYLDGGNARAFLPLTVKSFMRGQDGITRYVAEDDFGSPLTFYYTDALKKVTRLGQSDYAVPTSVSWMPLRGKSELIAEPMAFSKTSSPNVVMAELVGDGEVFSWRGPSLSKLASEKCQFIDRDEAAFLGVCLGLSPSFIKEAVDRASRGKCLSFNNTRIITPAHEKMAAAQDSVREALDELEVPIHNYFLVKEASVLDDALSVDKILGLNFINAENVSTFVDMLPSLEDTLSKMAELLNMVRLGEKEVPEAAVERMLVALEDVINGLKSLKQKERSYM